MLVNSPVDLIDRTTMRSLEVDLDLSIDLSRAASSDNLADTANYSDLVREISRAFASSDHASLAEAAASAAEAVLAAAANADGVKLTVRDPRVTFGTAVGRIGVSVERSRRGTVEVAPHDDAANMRLSAKRGWA
ncbi:dihydroneopterin aldolase [Bradyrhizobium sp. Leo170]|uniref:dihydroneopterin aldolase n=1 Tax=Bradyrhizobium sp. Leo170 TaxID=1571199 RepID=UPI00102E75F9|nr:dihydroneopterin aldolase [Bradyrhizobium sp. Leo170]